MKTVYIILMFAAGFTALFEQSKAKPNVVVMAIAIVVFMAGLMRFMAKIPSKNKESEHENNRDV